MEPLLLLDGVGEAGDARVEHLGIGEHRDGEDPTHHTRTKLRGEAWGPEHVALTMGALWLKVEFEGMVCSIRGDSASLARQ